MERCEEVGINLVFDKNAIQDFLSTGYPKTEKMMFQKVVCLFPASYLLVQDGKVNLKHDWHSSYHLKRSIKLNINKAVFNYDNLIFSSIKKYSDIFKTKRPGCLLSGGHDSSLIYAILAKIHKTPIHTFCASIKDAHYDEAPKASSVNDIYHGTFHNVVVGSESLDYLPELIRLREEPVAGSSLPVYMCALEAKKYVDTMFVGDGNDALWAEYYPIVAWHDIVSRFPLVGRRAIHALAKCFRSVSRWERFSELEFVLSLFIKKDVYQNFYRNMCSYWHFNSSMMRRLLSREEFSEIEFSNPFIEVDINYSNFFDALIESKLIYGTSTYMNASTVKPLEYHGMKVSMPFISRDVVEFVNKLPRDYIVKGNYFQKLSHTAQQKYLHMKVLERYLPHDLVYTKKQGFHMPFHALFKGRDVVLDRLHTALNKRSWFNHEFLERLFYEFSRQHVKKSETVQLELHGYRIFMLLSFEIWYREFVENYRKKYFTRIPLEEYLL
jgi:asparagine synthase (glutamine-hydrolysing)